MNVLPGLTFLPLTEYITIPISKVSCSDSSLVMPRTLVAADTRGYSACLTPAAGLSRRTWSYRSHQVSRDSLNADLPRTISLTGPGSLQPPSRVQHARVSMATCSASSSSLSPGSATFPACRSACDHLGTVRRSPVPSTELAFDRVVAWRPHVARIRRLLGATISPTVAAYCGPLRFEAETVHPVG